MGSDDEMEEDIYGEDFDHDEDQDKHKGHNQ